MESWNAKLFSVSWGSALMGKLSSLQFGEEKNTVEFEKLVTHTCKERTCETSQGEGRSKRRIGR